MFKRYQKTPVRSEWSEFSLRSRPPKIQRFQAGLGNNTNDEEENIMIRKTERELLRRKPFLRNENVADSIDFDVLTIAMSYPEGRQKMLDNLDAKSTSNHSNKKERSDNPKQKRSSSKALGDNKDLSKPEKQPTLQIPPKGHSQGHSSRSLAEEKSLLRTGQRGDKDNNKKLQKNQSKSRPDTYKETNSGSSSRSPEILNNKRRGKFTKKRVSERRKQTFSLQDILGKQLDNAKVCKGNNIDDDLDESVEKDDSNVENLAESEGMESTYHGPDIVFNNSFAVDMDAWLEEMEGNNEDNSLLALLNSPMVEDDNNNNKSSSDTEVEIDSDDARYYYENMVDANLPKHGSSDKIWSNGSLVWGRLSKIRWWPGIVIEGPMAGQKLARPSWAWLMWFGDHKISQMRLSQIVSFAHQFRQHCRGKLSSAVEGAIIEALKVCADRANVSVDGYNNIKKWGMLEMGFLEIVEAADNDDDPFPPKTGSEFPAKILKELKKLRDQTTDSDVESDEDVSVQREEPLADTFVVTEKFENDVYKDVDFCVSCAKHERKIVGQHPLFEGYVCSKCKDGLMESLLALDNDGCYLFCSVCGEGGELHVCEANDCGRSFCVRCMGHYLSSDAVKMVKSRSPWLCFLCSKYSKESHGVLVPRDEWQDELIKFYNPVFDQVIPSYHTTGYTGRKLRVLSLFDGIGSARIALDLLHLDVEVYYAAEIDPNAQQVSLFNQGFAVVQLGDIKSLTRNKLQEICPIDLVIGNPPEEDLDVTNREYEGFNGNGILMFRFLLLLKDIEFVSHGNPIYWLVENTANMKSEYRNMISSVYQTEACMWDAQFFSPYILPKLFWGNIPGLYRSFEYYKKTKGQFPTLEPYLATNVNRTSQIKLRNCAIDMEIMSTGESFEEENTWESFEEEKDETILDTGNNKEAAETTKLQPDLNTANCSVFSQPVQMDGKQTNIWLDEVERVLGLPSHYTDVSKLTIPQRQKLLKQASSVHVLKHLLRPLTEIFLTRA